MPFLTGFRRFWREMRGKGSNLPPYEPIGELPQLFDMDKASKRLKYSAQRKLSTGRLASAALDDFLELARGRADD